MNPKLIKYFDTSYNKYTTEYLINKDRENVYLCSKLSYKVACDLGIENELYKVDTRYLPIDWCNYQELYNNSYFNHIPQIIEKNYEKILEIARDNFELSVRIIEFLEEFYEYACKKDFIRICRVAIIVNHKYIPDKIMQSLFNIVFDFYHELLEENKLSLLIDSYTSHFFIKFEEKAN
ncbi:hypothetical protein COA01_30700 [Bacillus cereus]|uniref:hypothetical protein n=1 Tax=Bacillus cereus TaxID=1396 RepID=UPI000BFD3B51|nr:hypothetical protein [Bacillus cereus]PGP14722.1 hypothetical protein COA01_30700 [Bacillus cereus]